MIKILTGWSNPGGSTVAHINLVNLFNEKGFDACLYGPHSWATNKCKFDYLKNLNIDKEDYVIVHFFPNIVQKPICKKLIYSCHETNIAPLSSIDTKPYDLVHFVSESQRKWHDYKGKSCIIPNVLDNLVPKPQTVTGKAGVIGSIDPHKQTHISIQRAYEDGFREVLLYGSLNDIGYFNDKVRYWIEEGVAKLIGHVDNKQEMYNSVETVYHSSLRETFNYVKGECRLTNTTYDGLPSAESGAVYESRDKIFFDWLKELE